MSCELSRSERLSRTKRGARRKAIAPTGTFTKKIHSQPRYFVSSPPASTPTAAPLPPIAPQMPSALLRSGPSSKVVITIESAAGEMIAAPRPWTARETIRTDSVEARPQTNDATVKTTTPASLPRRRRRLHRRVIRLRPRLDRDGPDRLARSPGPGRGDHLAGGALDRDHDLRR